MLAQIQANPWMIISRILLHEIFKGVSFTDRENMSLKVRCKIQQTVQYVKNRLSHDLYPEIVISEHTKEVYRANYLPCGFRLVRLLQYVKKKEPVMIKHGSKCQNVNAPESRKKLSPKLATPKKWQSLQLW